MVFFIMTLTCTPYTGGGGSLLSDIISLLVCVAVLFSIYIYLISHPDRVRGPIYFGYMSLSLRGMTARACL